MAAPSSDGGPAFSLEPSVTSSHSLDSQTRRADADNGEGGSAPARFRGGGTATGDGRAASQGSGSSRLAPEAIDERDFAHRRHRADRAAGRSGGGFLLAPTLPSGPRDGSRGKSRHRPDSRHSSDSRGKRSTLDVPPANVSPANVSPANVSPANVPPNGAPPVAPPSRRPVAPPVDPNQLVHMALNLSESRRRNISASQLLGAQSRAPSSAHREGSFSHAGGSSSLRQYLNEQRRVSRNLSPMGKASPARHMSASMQSSGTAAFPARQTSNPSPATLLRRDRARAYIELRAEYMRLLAFLPPLKDDANAPGNFTYTTNAVPGSPHAYLTRTPSYANKKHDLGRPYNPIQALRNRRSRARERLALPHEPAAFSDIEQVHEWIDDIEEHSKTPGFRLEGRVALPQLHHDHELQAGTQAKSSKSQQGWSFTPEELLADAYWLEHGNNKAVIEDRLGRRIFPPREPPQQQKNDFLAPRPSKESSRRRSWVDGVSGTDPGTGDESEQGSERGRKRRLLPKIRANSRLRTGRGSPRKHSIGYSDSSDSDVDVRKVRKSFDIEHNTGPLALQIKRRLELQTQGLNNNKTPAADTPDTPDKWGRAPPEVPDGKTLRNSLDVPRFANGSSTRIDDKATLKMPPRNRTNPLTPIKSAEPRSSFEDDSTAPSTPLHVRHFPHIGSDLSPPHSTDDSDRTRSKRSKFNPFHFTHDHDKHEHKHDHDKHGHKHEHDKHGHKHEHDKHGHKHDHDKHGHKHEHDKRGHKHDHDKHGHKHEQDTTALDKKQASRQTSEEAHEPSGLGTAIFAAPGAVKNLLSHRKNDSVSSLDSPDKLRRKGAQDLNNHSAVTRFFKGVKHEGTKVGDIIFRRDRADDTDASTVSDRNSIDFDDNERRRPGLSRTVTSTTAGSASEKEGRSHLKLPSFRPVHKALSDSDDASDLEHHISRQSRERRNDRSSRIDRLLPPRMDLERVSTASSTATLGPTRSHDQDYMKTQLARPGGVLAFTSNLPPTALKAAQNRHRSGSRPTLQGKRHWSITDDDDEHHLHRRKRNAVSQADIARVRALFLCSGVKAKEISRRAHSRRDPAPGFLLLAAQTAARDIFPIPRKEEHVLAARILVTDLERGTSALHRACDAFRAGTIKDLNARIVALRESIEADLMPRVFEAGDAAVQITSEVSGQGPLHVKQISDEIERMLRQRRRHSRWVMSWGWSVVEWGIVVALRLASVVFAGYGLLKSLVVVVWGVLRWLLWL
ncbi:uncharacterized protein M421DRAFT_415076 [Didymella exigua CBS 183.55]|uniref:REJ domain-containing protein n=1 Tax=Didymella exigua CBS 183.55 TaxID=1150837 RepID=A0A6A5S3K5_9PLEO|nr:uncharacterized protein M421DRAFT_415076 [Didymella exigua CBS 183.55]KAF1934024.1 hypothetical protein M421DRAFT_415076 [Didymella exigua CBS 183.55]